MGSVLGSIFGFGDKMKRRLRDAVSNPADYAEMTADENRNEWKRNPDERSLGFFNPVPLGTMSPFVLRQQMREAIAEIPRVENSIYSKMPGQTLKDTKYVQRNVREQAELDHMIESGFLLPKAGGKSKKYFTAVDEVNPNVPAGNTMIRIARDKVKPDEAVSVRDAERFNFSTGSWEPLIKESSPVNISRRNFLKKSGGIAAGAATAGVIPKLLRKFAAEEKPIADAVAQTAKEAPKYKYNSLKDYLDDVETSAVSKFDDPRSAGWDVSTQDLMKERLLLDEAEHKTAKFFYKDNLKDPQTGKWINPYDGQPHSEEFLKNIRNTTNDFSPQAKKEMSAWKEMRGRGWENIDDFSRESIGRGLMPNYNGSLVKNPANDTYHHYLPGQEGRISDGFNSLDEARNSMTKTLQKAFRNKIQNGF